MGRLPMAGLTLKLLLRFVGGICLLALVSLWMPRSWIEVGHR